MTRTSDPRQTLVGVGPSLAADLHDLGYREPANLRGEDPELRKWWRWKDAGASGS